MSAAELASPQQIVVLEHEGNSLFAEVIQVILVRQRYWVRPLLLSAASEGGAPGKLYNLRETADLILPIALFRPALDTEAIPLLMQLESRDRFSREADNPHPHLRAFVEQIWKAHRPPKS